MNNRRWVVVCAAAVVIARAAMWKAGTVSGDEWLPISPAELKMTSVPEAPGAPAVWRRVYALRPAAVDGNRRQWLAA